MTPTCPLPPHWYAGEGRGEGLENVRQCKIWHGSVSQLPPAKTSGAGEKEKEKVSEREKLENGRVLVFGQVSAGGVVCVQLCQMEVGMLWWLRKLGVCSDRKFSWSGCAGSELLARRAP